MKHLLVVYHSQGGGTQQMADAVLRGARREANEVEIREKAALEGTVGDLLWADGVIFGTPENFGTMSGALKYFFDETFYPAQGKIRQLPYALFVKCGNDGSGATRDVDRIAKGFPLRRIAEPVICQGEVGDEILAACDQLGQTLAAGIAMGLWS